MRKKITTLMLCMSFMICVNAQQRTDYFFYSECPDYMEGRYSNSMIPYRTIEVIGFQDVMIESVPIGSGTMFLGGLCLIYCILKRKGIEK